MANIDSFMNTFQSGEINPLLFGRTDSDFYMRSCRQLENMYVHVEGPASKRGGFKYIAAAMDEDAQVRLLPFEFSSSQAYVLEFGERYIRVLANDGIVQDTREFVTNGDFASGTTGWTSTGTFSVTSGVATLTAGTIVQTMTLLTGVECKIDADVTSGTPVFAILKASDDSVLHDNLSAGDTFTLAQTPTPDPFETLEVKLRVTSSGTSVFDNVSLKYSARDFSVSSPYAADELGGIQFVQSADVLFLVHPNHAPRTFIRSLDASDNVVFTVELYEFEDGPYQTANGDENFKIAPSATSGTSITLTASGAGFAPFSATDVGRFVRLKHTNWGHAKITAYTSPTVVTASVVKNFDATTATSDWSLGAWSETTGWPACVTIFEQRLCFANTRTQPQSIWATVSGDFYLFSPTEKDGTVADDSGLAIDIGSPKVSIIQWISGAQYLIVGTSGGPYRSATTNNAPLSSATAKFLYNNGIECSSIQPIQVGTTLVFPQKQRKKVYSLQYDFGYDTLKDVNVTQYAEHRFIGRIKEFTLQQEPNSLIWAVMDDGALVSGTFEPQQNVIAWGGNVVGGTFRGQPAKVESLVTISADGEDNLWAVVRRTIDGVDRRYIERISEERYDIGQEFLVFADSAAVINNPIAISNITKNLSDITITTATAHGFSNGDKVRVCEIVGSSEINRTSHIVTVLDSTNFTIPVPPATVGDYVDGGEVRKYFQTITGLDHLEGESVVILGDGAVQPNEVVVGGSITMTEPCVVAIVGLGYSSILRPRSYVGATFPTGNIQSRKVKNVDTTLLLYRSLGLKYGTDLGKLTALPFRTTNDLMGEAIPLFTGKKEKINVPSVFEYDEGFYLVNDQPLPLTVQAIHYTLDVTR